MTGIVYAYISPRGKVYIGQTTNEQRRRETFLDPTQEYAGKKMELERKMYPNFNRWKYRVLTTVDEDDPKILKEKLTFLEAYYIIKNQSILGGLNTYLADIDTICKNRYLKSYYSDPETDYYGKMEVLMNIEPDLLCSNHSIGNDEFYYSSTAYVNDPFWLNEIKKRLTLFVHIVCNSNEKALKNTVSKIHKYAPEYNSFYSLN